MGEIKSKKLVRRVKAANSPEPSGPVGGSTEDETVNPACGHGGCGRHCSVRYVGPTSHIRDHHIVHAAKGVTHIWSAAVITGFAIVLTGAIALNVAQAKSDKKAEVSQQKVKQDVGRDIRGLSQRMAAMEDLLKKVAAECIKPTAGTTAPSAGE